MPLTCGPSLSFIDSDVVTGKVDGIGNGDVDCGWSDFNDADLEGRFDEGGGSEKRCTTLIGSTGSVAVA